MTEANLLKIKIINYTLLISKWNLYLVFEWALVKNKNKYLNYTEVARFREANRKLNEIMCLIVRWIDKYFVPTIINLFNSTANMLCVYT